MKGILTVRWGFFLVGRGEEARRSEGVPSAQEKFFGIVAEARPVDDEAKRGWRSGQNP